MIMIKKFDDALTALNAISELRQRAIDKVIDEYKFTIKSLGAKDETDTFISCMELWGQAFIYQHKIETLSRAITHVNDVSLESIGVDDRRQIIGTWNQELVDELYLEYANLLGILETFLDKIRLTSETNVVGAKKYKEEKEKIENEEKLNENSENKESEDEQIKS